MTDELEFELKVSLGDVYDASKRAVQHMPKDARPDDVAACVYAMLETLAVERIMRNPEMQEGK